MRLGKYECQLTPGTLAARAYGEATIFERHRHRYEFNNAYRSAMEAAGLRFSGVNAERGLVEIVENAESPFFVGVQFHPEFGSRPDRPQPLFCALVAAAAQ